MYRALIMIVAAFFFTFFLIGAGFINQKKFSQKVPTGVVLAAQNIDTEAHEKFHYPFINEVQIKAIPYLTLPFRKADLQKKPLKKDTLFEVTEGWTYSDEELKITNVDPLHGGIDYYVPYGTPIVAPADGYAMGTYQMKYAKEKKTSLNEFGEEIEEEVIRKYEGKPVGMGGGYFVKMYIPTVNRFIFFAHLSDIDKGIPFHPPTPDKEPGEWNPTNSKLPVEDWINQTHTVFIKKGTVVGKTGVSGLTWGYDEYQEGATRPVVMDPTKYKSWDETHLHFEDQWIDAEKEEVGWQRDLYGIYSTHENYPTYEKPLPLGKDPLFFLNKNGQPKFADE